jgi:hypothetical protein
MIPQDDGAGHFVRYFIFAIASREGGLRDLVQFASPAARAIGNFEFFSEVKSTS